MKAIVKDVKLFPVIGVTRARTVDMGICPHILHTVLANHALRLSARPRQAANTVAASHVSSSQIFCGRTSAKLHATSIYKANLP